MQMIRIWKTISLSLIWRLCPSAAARSRSRGWSGRGSFAVVFVLRWLAPRERAVEHPLDENQAVPLGVRCAELPGPPGHQLRRAVDPAPRGARQAAVDVENISLHTVQRHAAPRGWHHRLALPQLQAQRPMAQQWAFKCE